MADVRRSRLDVRKRTAEWAADLEGQRKAAERVVEESKERLREAEEMRSEALRGAEEAEREFGRMSEQLEQTRRAAAAAAEVEEQRRVAAVAAVDASHALRLAQERVGEMTGKMNKKEREFVDVEADIAAAEREAEAATRESEAAKEEERRLARDGNGGGGGGGGASELERKKEELSWMRGQLEEAQHTVMRANELEQQRRAAADAFESAARSVARADSSSSGRGAPAPDPRGVPTAEQLAGREAELAGMRRELDELDRSGRALSEHVNEMRRVMAGEASDPRGVPTREQLETRVAELDAARRRMEEGKSAVARLESHVGEMRARSWRRRPRAARNPPGAKGPRPTGATAPPGAAKGPRRRRRTAAPRSSRWRRRNTSAGRRTGARTRFRAAYEEKSRAMETLRADVERGSQLGDRSSADSSEERRRRALVVAAESSYKARQAEERASGLRSQRDERRRELEWMRGEIANAERGIEPLRRAAEDTAEREREMDAKAARLAEEARRSGASGWGAERDPASSPAFASSSRHPVDDYKTREAREAVEKAENDLRWHRGELDAKTEEARKAAAERDSQIESLEFTLSGVEITTSPETRYNAEDTATASFRIRQIEERADRLESERAESDGTGSRSAESAPRGGGARPTGRHVHRERGGAVEGEARAREGHGGGGGERSGGGGGKGEGGGGDGGGDARRRVGRRREARKVARGGARARGGGDQGTQRRDRTPRKPRERPRDAKPRGWVRTPRPVASDDAAPRRRRVRGGDCRRRGADDEPKAGERAEARRARTRGDGGGDAERAHELGGAPDGDGGDRGVEGGAAREDAPGAPGGAGEGEPRAERGEDSGGEGAVLAGGGGDRAGGRTGRARSGACSTTRRWRSSGRRWTSSR